MERGVIQADARHTTRRMKIAMQGNVIRALVEFVTNSDDSYIRLESESKAHSGVIDILYNKKGYARLFAVRDYAEGMLIEDVRSSFKKYGGATSGMQTGKKVRGYFGQGAKDALACMADGKICTFKDDIFIECKLFIENGKPWYEISNAIPTTAELRKLHKIDGNGTIAYFQADPPNVPQLKTVHEELANNYLLRKIMTNPLRKIYLWDGDSNEKRRLRYQPPEGKEILGHDFMISYSDYGNFPIHITIWRAEKGELSQVGDTRDGGLLIVDDEDIVLGITLFRYDHNPDAARFFGEVKISGFRNLLQKEEPVLSEERDGLISRHPFCQLLIPEIEKRIESKVKDERLRRQQENQTKIDSDEMSRYKKAFNILNEIAEIEALSAINLGRKPSDQIVDPPDGFCLYPSSAQITVGKRYNFELCLNTKVVRHGSDIQITCSNQKIRLLTTRIRISYEDGDGVVSKYITVEGTEPNVDGIIKAVTGNRLTQAKVMVVPEKELLLSEGMVFQPESLTLRPNQPRKVYLLVYVKMIEDGSVIKVKSDNETIHVSQEEIVVNETDAVRHVLKYELEIWGEGAGQAALISAEHETYMALLEVHVKSKEDVDERKSKKGMFNEPEFNHDPEPLQRTRYNEDTGKVIIYVNFPSVKHYLGSICEYNKTLPAQILIADLVAERCFYEIAKKKVDSSGALIRVETRLDKIQSEANMLSSKYGKKVHEILVDQNLVKEAKELVQI